MSGKRGSSGSAVRPPEIRKRGPDEKPVSYILICDDDEGNLGNSCSESARVSRSGGHVAGRNGDEETSIVVFDDNVGPDEKMGVDVDGGGDDDVLLLSVNGCVGLVEGNAGPLNANLEDVDDRYGALVGSLPMDWDVPWVEREYKQFLEMLRVDGTAYSVELSALDGRLSFVLEYEKGVSGSNSRRPGLQERCGSRTWNGKEGSAALVGGQTKSRTWHGSLEQKGEEAVSGLMKCAGREHANARDDRGPEGRKRKFSDVFSTGTNKGSQHVKTRAFGPRSCKPNLPVSKKLGSRKHSQTKPQKSHGSLEQNGKEAVRGLMKCARREHVNAHDDRGPKGKKFSAVSSGVKKGSHHVKTRAFEPGTCKPILQASKWLDAESAGLQNSQVQDEEMPDETWLNLLNSLTKHVETRAFEPRTCKPVVQVGKLLVGESACLQKSQVQNEVVLDAGKNSQSSSHSDSDVMILEVNPYKSATPWVVLDDDEEVKNFSSRSDCPQLKQLLELLKQPYSKSELLANMKEFRLRRPLIGHYELRNGRKSYTTEFVGQSYADWHRDLADQIRTSKEEPKTLNLLRGFFYWLQHAGHGSMDKPWKDPACLSVLPVGAMDTTSLLKNEKT